MLSLFIVIIFVVNLDAKVPECSEPAPSSIVIDSESIYFPVAVDYGASHKKMIYEGSYYSVHPRIDEIPFYGTGTRIIPIHLIKFKWATKFCKIIPKLRELGLRPATAQELMALRIEIEKELGKKWDFPIVALGSFLEEDSLVEFLVPSLEGNAEKRSLELVRGDGYGWRSYVRFAAVPIYYSNHEKGGMYDEHE